MFRIKHITPVILVMNDEFWLPYTLASVKGRFCRYVIYDVGSKDQTGNIIDWFVESESKSDRVSMCVRKLPECTPDVQGVFRNSMIAEARSEWYWILDGDEVYSEESMKALKNYDLRKKPWYPQGEKIYGMVRRVEMDPNLRQRYDRQRSHHRLYHRTAIWKGTHPGEAAVIPQEETTQAWLPGITCWHFHNALRSPLEGEVPRRIERKKQGTYHPGNLENFNLLEELPLLRKPIAKFAVCPQLEELQKEHANI